MKKGKLKDTRVNRGRLKYFNKDFFYGTVSPEVRRRANVISKSKSGGLTNTVPPKRGPNPQGLKNGGCPHREAGVRSPYQGVSGIQVKGQKFTGVK